MNNLRRKLKFLAPNKIRIFANKSNGFFFFLPKDTTRKLSAKKIASYKVYKPVHFQLSTFPEQNNQLWFKGTYGVY